jgi:hypothetical protein
MERNRANSMEATLYRKKVGLEMMLKMVEACDLKVKTKTHGYKGG